MPARVTDTSLAEHWSALEVPKITTEVEARRLLHATAPERWIRDAAADQRTSVSIVGMKPLPLGDREVTTLELRVGTPPLACTAHLWVDDRHEWRCSVFYLCSDVTNP